MLYTFAFYTEFPLGHGISVRTKMGSNGRDGNGGFSGSDGHHDGGRLHSLVDIDHCHTAATTDEPGQEGDEEDNANGNAKDDAHAVSTLVM